jgi:uncharacterized protein HemX
MKGKEWAVAVALALASGLVAAGAVKMQSDDNAKTVDRHETILRDHETRLSKVEQLGQDTNETAHAIQRALERRR